MIHVRDIWLLLHCKCIAECFEKEEFLLHNAMLAWCTLCLSVCLSVCLSISLSIYPMDVCYSGRTSTLYKQNKH